MFAVPLIRILPIILLTGTSRGAAMLIFSLSIYAETRLPE